MISGHGARRHWRDARRGGEARRSAAARRDRRVRRRRPRLRGDERALRRRCGRPAKRIPRSPSMMKYAGTELNKRRNELVMAAGGSDALEWDSERSKNGKAAARLAAHQGQFDRGRHQRDPAQHRRQAHPRPAGSLTMTLLTDDQKMLQETAASFLAEEGSIAKQLRHWRDTGCKDGFGHGLWKQFAELGLTGICIPGGTGRPWPGRGRGGAGARGDRPQPDPLALPHHRGRRLHARSRARRTPSAGSRASSPARPCWRWRSTKAAGTRPSRLR